MCSIETETKHQFEGINESNLYYFEILSSHVDPLPSREDIFNNGVFTEFGMTDVAGNDLKNSVTSFIKKIKTFEPSRLTPALNDAGNYVDFNTTIFHNGDLIEIIMTARPNYNQTVSDGTYYDGPGVVVVRVILKLVLNPN
jgi:hypothetical protein